MELIKKGSECFDFLGINYYQSACVKAPTPGAARRSKQNNKIGKGGHVVYEVQPDLFEGCKNEFIGDTDFSMPIDGRWSMCWRTSTIATTSRNDLRNGFGAYDKLEKTVLSMILTALSTSVSTSRP